MTTDEAIEVLVGGLVSNAGGEGDDALDTIKDALGAVREDERLLHKAWACLTGADSVLSLIFHRYRSMLPDDVQRDVEASYTECRRTAAECKVER